MPPVTPNVTSESTDLVFRPATGDVRLMLYRQPKPRTGDLGSPQFERQFGPMLETQQLHFKDVPLIYEDLTGGCAVSRPYAGIHGYSEAENLCFRHPGIGTPAGLVTEVPIPSGVSGLITEFREFQTDLYFCVGRYLLKCTAGSGDPQIVQDLGAGFTADGMVVFDGALWIGGYGGNLRKWDGATLSISTNIAPGKLDVVEWILGGDLATGLPGSMTAGQHYTVMIATVGTFNASGIRFVPTGSDPLDGNNWRSAIPIGNSSSPIARIVCSNGHAYFTKGGPDGGVFDLDETGRTPNLAHLFRDNQTAANGGAAYVYDGALFVSFGFGVVMIPLGDLTRQDVPQECGVGYGLPNESSLHGWALDFTNEGGWLVEALYSPLALGSKVCYGRRRERLGTPGPGPMLWHGAEVNLPNIQVTRLKTATAANTPRLWIGAITAATTTTRVFWVSLPQAQTPFEDLLLSGPMRFAPTGSVTFTTGTWERGGGESDLLKNLDRWMINADNLSHGAIFTLAADADGGLSKTYVVQGQARSQKRSRFLPSGAPRSGYEITPRISYSGTTTQPGLFRSLRADASIVTEQTPEMIYPVMIGEGILDRAGNPITENPEVLKARVYDLQRLGPLSLTDQRGRQLSVRVQPGIGETIAESPDGAGWVTVLRLRVAILQQVAYYNEDAYYNLFDVYGGSGAVG